MQHPAGLLLKWLLVAGTGGVIAPASWRVAKGEIHIPGTTRGQLHIAGPLASEVHVAGAMRAEAKPN
jgi:hypothetical protein